jgi:hypothetical protein
MTEYLTRPRRLPPGFDLDGHLAGLDADGFTIVKDYLSEDQLARFREGLKPYLNTHRGRNPFEGLAISASRSMTRSAFPSKSSCKLRQRDRGPARSGAAVLEAGAVDLRADMALAEIFHIAELVVAKDFVNRGTPSFYALGGYGDREHESGSELLGDAGKNGPPRTVGRGERADRCTAAQQVDLVEQVDDVEPELERADLRQCKPVRYVEIDLDIGRQ